MTIRGIDMAHLHVMGPYRGPGEQKTVETLREQLPASWDIVASKSLPGTKDDLDIVVLAPGTIFLLEEKSWGPEIEASDISWLTSHGSYPSPIDRVAHLSRVLAGVLRNRVPLYKEEVGRRHAVLPGVVLSHDALELSYRPNFDDRELLLPLLDSRAADELRARADVPAGQRFSPELRKAILEFLTGLGARDEAPKHIGQYKVETELSPLGYARCFIGTSLDNTGYLLRCVPIHGWGIGVDISEVALRESKALYQLDRLRRTPRCLPAFKDEERQWIVTPIEVRLDERSLARSIRLNDPKRDNGALPEEVSRKVIADAFTGLGEIHAEDLVHRGISPLRVHLGRALRVQFTDFVMAHLPSGETIGEWLGGFDQDSSVRYRAPECKADPRLATTASDVYSLALSLAGWLVGDITTAATDLQPMLDSFGEVGALLAECLASDPSARPSAKQAADRLAPQIPEPATEATPDPDGPFVWEEGNVLAGRYELRRKLGSGGFATTWLARDTNVNQDRVIKVFHNPETAQTALAEFIAMSQVSHDHCARTWDRGSIDTDTTYLVNEYVEGETLEDHLVSAQPDAEDIRTIALDVLAALTYLHEKQLLHRDISPRNIVVGPSGRAKLIDFGLIAKPGGGTVAGTVPYMAPEVLRGGVASERTDVYSMAVTFLEGMLGRLPYTESDTGRVLDMPTDAELHQWGGLGESILDVLYAAARTEVDQRVSSAKELSERLQMALGAEVAEGGANVNPTVNALRQGYRGSRIGNAANRGLDNDFLQTTYIPTRLDIKLLPELLNGKLRAVFLTGNPGDGKTAFLVKVRETLELDGGTVAHTDEAGWTIDRRGHRFIAVYDASESNSGLSSDELLNLALTPEGGRSETGHTVLLAINDGRLLQFFTDFEHLYDDHARATRAHFRRQPPPFDDIAVVDLKERSLASLSDDIGLAVQVAERFTSPERWSECTTCLSRELCPMLKNARELHSVARKGLAELVLTSHLRRLRRATFRDLRSALGWLITGDLSCEEVHDNREQRLDLSRNPKYRIANLAFSQESSDYLIQEWALLDPARTAAPEVARAGEFVARGQASAEALANFQRELFLGSVVGEEIGPQSVRTYRHFADFTSMLAEPTKDDLHRLLLGLSRIVGASGFSGDGLAIAAGERNEVWAVLNTIPSDHFSLRLPDNSGSFVEGVPDRVELVHRDGPRLDLSLDTAELAFRAANGELLDDVYSDAVRQEIEGFTAQLSTQPSDRVLVIDEVGSAVAASRSGQNIELVEQ